MEIILALTVAIIAIIAVLFAIKRGTKPKYMLRMMRKIAEEQAAKCQTALDELDTAIFLAEDTITEYRSMQYADGTDESIVRAQKIEEISEMITLCKKLADTEANGQAPFEFNARHLSQSQCRIVQTDLAGIEREGRRAAAKLRRMDRRIRHIAGIDDSAIRSQLER